jgi:hypothetical protein
MSRAVVVMLCAVLLPAPLLGHPVDQARPSQPARVTPTAKPAQEPARPTPAPARRRGSDVNLQIELTINDQGGAGASPGEKKVVSMLVADGTFGRVRSQASNVGSRINFDARPQILDSGGILIELTIEYLPANKEGVATGNERLAVLNESLSVILQNGKPQVISQASDPAYDRRMTAEVRATIVK